ncbi:KPN_02809 family neutral zinc metallopeptidase [Pseudonocardia parietis]|uniref:Metalloprotease n=1 Tax=Pseudonocardia parietis TaxID=570936 RepID=A0ABS4VL34_9PSEU|nr:neutral zinc metallopeptidase [Pseudonocardia parietis]MBP2364615.1 putative metalloprotease [Pseudonocardia parietis]
MRFDENARLDTSGVDDLRGSGGGRIGGRGGGVGGRVAGAGGGLGVVGLIIYLLLSNFAGVDMGGMAAGGGYPSLNQVGAGQTADNASLEQNCATGASANNSTDCRMVAVVNSLDDFWAAQFSSGFARPRTNFFSGGVSTDGCGSATSDSGPFYCPADSEIYIDLSFFQDLQTRFGAEGGPFAQSYVMAHEYGHHIQNLLGTNRRVGNETGPTSGSVRLELQADCYAGVWAHHATTVPGDSGRPLITDLTPADIDAALDTAAKIGDDHIQTHLGGGRVDESQFSHGSSAQRERWFTTGLDTGDANACDTFAARDLD